MPAPATVFQRVLSDVTLTEFFPVTDSSRHHVELDNPEWISNSEDSASQKYDTYALESTLESNVSLMVVPFLREMVSVFSILFLGLRIRRFQFVIRNLATKRFRLLLFS